MKLGSLAQDKISFHITSSSFVLPTCLATRKIPRVNKSVS